jgi:hypothetical protein
MKWLDKCGKKQNRFMKQFMIIFIIFQFYKLTKLKIKNKKYITCIDSTNIDSLIWGGYFDGAAAESLFFTRSPS